HEERETKQHKINHAPEDEFEERREPILAIDLSNRDLQLDHDREREQCTNHWGKRRWRFPGKQKPDADNQHCAQKNKRVGVEREEQMLDVITAFKHVEDF